MKAVLATALLLGLPTFAACVAPPVDRSRSHVVQLEVVFDPPLAAPGELFVVDESGGARRIVTGCTGAVIEVAPGPASLRLVAGSSQWETVLTAPSAAGATAQHVWHLAQ